MSKRKAQLTAARRKQAWRMSKSYQLAKLLAESIGVPTPHARNEGAEFDEWLVAALEVAVGDIVIEVAGDLLISDGQLDICDCDYPEPMYSVCNCGRAIV